MSSSGDKSESNARTPVSAVIPCYRCAATVGRAVASVVRQSLPPAEVILVDDGSKDETLNELYRQAKLYPNSNIRVIPLPMNSGPGAARNTGWEAATQPYIAFLDADDAWHPRKLEIQYQWMRDHPKVAMTGNASSVWPAAHDICIDTNAVRAEQVPSWLMLISNRFPTRSVMLKRELPFRFDPTKRYSEDYLLWLTIILSGFEGWRLQPVLAWSYRPECSPGGYSGALWTQERRELSTLRKVYQEKLIPKPIYWLASCVSAAKYLRRQLSAWILRRGTADS